MTFPLRPKEGSQESAGPRSKRALEEEEGGADTLSKNKQKKQLRNPHKTFDPSLKRELLQLLHKAAGEAWGLGPAFLWAWEVQPQPGVGQALWARGVAGAESGSPLPCLKQPSLPQ